MADHYSTHTKVHAHTISATMIHDIQSEFLRK